MHKWSIKINIVLKLNEPYLRHQDLENKISTLELLKAYALILKAV